jgi:GT2 family glycosyltransferase/glycosyltransferase involved in cell wall biosynthesis
LETPSLEDRLMKILVVVHGFPPAAQGGTEIYAHAHAQALRRQHGDEILVLTREQDPSRDEYAVRNEYRDGLRITWINNTFRRTRTFEETYRNAAIGEIAARLIDEFRPDVAHIHHLTCLSTTIVPALAARSIPCFMTLHDYWLICHRGQLLDVNYGVCAGPEPSGCGGCVGSAGRAGPLSFVAARALRELERRLPTAPAHRLRSTAEWLGALLESTTRDTRESLKRLEHMRGVCADVTHFFAPSRYVRDRFVQFGIAPERITIHPIGTIGSAFRGDARTAGDRLRVGFVGSVMISKGPHVLLEAIRQLPAGTVSVDLFGGHVPYHGDKSYAARIERLSAGQDVRIHGAITHERVASVLSTLDVLVVPSIWPENSPVVVQEAFLAGLPVVAARIGGIPELIDDGRNGLLFEPGDSTDLARVLKRLVAEAGLLAALRGDAAGVKTIEDDVRATRVMYEARAIARPTPRRRRMSAVVLNFRTADDTLLAVKSLRAARRPLDDIIVVDNDRSDALRDALQSTSPSIRYVATTSNLGFSGGMNAGIREALMRGADRVLLVNSDVIVPPDCCDQLERCLDATPGAAIAAPVIRSRSEPDVVASRGISYSESTGRMRQLTIPRSGAANGAEGDCIVDAVSGCVMLVDRAVFDRIGLFDTDYFFSFEDLDFCLKARAAGFATVLAERAVAYHEGSRSIGSKSPRRLYFAARGHLLLARRLNPAAGPLSAWPRAVSIVALNLAHAIISSGGTPAARVSAVVRGTRDYVTGRFGADD